MYIKQVKINNYRAFRCFTAELQKLTIIIGENNSGKSNFFNALALPLSKNEIDFNSKRLSISDINIECITEFYKSILDNETIDKQLSKIPKVSIELYFADPADSYESAILSKWLTDDNTYGIRYEFKPKNDDEFLESVKILLKDQTDKAIDINETKWFSLPLEFYEYNIVSINNYKSISYNDLKYTKINNINAERDDFSNNNLMKSNNILTSLLIASLEKEEKKLINNEYVNFFKAIENTKTFKKIMSNDPEFENINDLINQLECIPNLPNLKNILSNITLAYGEKFLYQKGLGQRNLIYIFILFAYYKANQKNFNLCCIEEPEAHLSVNNLKLATDYIYKSINNSSSLLQTLISTHSPSVINKLQISNVLVLTENSCTNLSNTPTELSNYLKKRPNFDILKLLFANKLILVEGTSDEMLINTYLSRKSSFLNNIDVIAIGQKGYKNFLDIWLQLNINSSKKIGIVRDFDDQLNAKAEHDKYDNEHANITIRTTEGYSLENDLIATGNNLEILAKLYNVTKNQETILEHMKKDKAKAMLEICDAMLRTSNPLDILLPDHMMEVIKELE